MRFLFGLILLSQATLTKDEAPFVFIGASNFIITSQSSESHSSGVPTAFPFFFFFNNPQPRVIICAALTSNLLPYCVIASNVAYFLLVLCFLSAA